MIGESAVIPHACPLCGYVNTKAVPSTGEICYAHCPVCNLVSIAPKHLLPPDEELERYHLHTNSPDEPGYRAFLERLSIPLVPLLTPGSEGLEFGCGPGPVLAQMLSDQGFTMHLYDPYFYPNVDNLKKTYDFVTSTEVIEHFYQPGREWDLLFELVKPGGIIAVMTRVMHADLDFTTWYYRTDPTHVSFYTRETFSWLAQKYGAKLTFPTDSGDIAFFRL